MNGESNLSGNSCSESSRYFTISVSERGEYNIHFSKVFSERSLRQILIHSLTVCLRIWELAINIIHNVTIIQTIQSKCFSTGHTFTASVK